MNRLLKQRLNRITRRITLAQMKRLKAANPGKEYKLVVYPTGNLEHSPQGGVVQGDPDAKPTGSVDSDLKPTTETEGVPNGQE